MTRAAASRELFQQLNDAGKNLNIKSPRTLYSEKSTLVGGN